MARKTRDENADAILTSRMESNNGESALTQKGDVSTSTSLVTTPEEQVLVIQNQLIRDMSSKLSDMMATVRSGLQGEMISLSTATMVSTLQSLQARLLAINTQLEGTISPILRPVIRSQITQLRSVIAGLFYQMLRVAASETDNTLLEQANNLAREIVKETIPNLPRLDSTMSSTKT